MLSLYGQHSQPYNDLASRTTSSSMTAASWNANLPQTIEAFFVIRNGDFYSTTFGARRKQVPFERGTLTRL